MELPIEVLVHNEQLGMKGTPGTLLQISPHGYYELNCTFGGNIHRVLLAVEGTALIAKEPEPAPIEGVEIEHYGV